MKALVTGGAGFIGHHLVKFLIDKKHEVVVFDLPSRKKDLTPSNVILIEGNITNKEDIEKIPKDIDVVFHLAAQARIPVSFEDPEGTMKINVEGTENMLEAFKNSIFVYTSSSAVYGNARMYAPEDTPLHPLSPYAESKIAAEKKCKEYAEKYGTKVTIIRPFNVYGAGQDPDNPYSGVMSKFAARAKNDQPLIIYGDGKQVRDFVHVSDVCNGFLLGTKKTGIYNIGTGKPTSINELAELVLKISGKKLEIKHEAPREGDIRESCADISKARKELGYKPKVTLEKGLKELI